MGDNGLYGLEPQAVLPPGHYKKPVINWAKLLPAIFLALVYAAGLAALLTEVGCG